MPVAASSIVAFILAVLGGAGLQLQQRELSETSLYAALIVVSLASLVLAWHVTTRKVVMLIALVAAGASVSYGQAGLRATWRLAEELPSGLEGQDLRLTGTIISLPVRGAAGQRFRFEVEDARRLDGTAARVPERLSLGWYHDADSPAPVLRAGEQWRFVVRLRQPHGHVNPHGFDYELALFEQGVRATGYVRATHSAQRLGVASGHVVERMRQRLRDSIDASVPDRRIAGLLAALTLGDQSAIERDDWEVFRATGVAHLMSISGLHVTMFAWLAGALIGAAWRRHPSLPLRLPAPAASRWGGLLAALAYAVFSGWGVPAQRTVWMLASVVLLQSLGLRWSWGMVMLAAALVVTLADPWALLQPGFWLSFSAVALLLASEPKQRGETTDNGGAMRLHRLVVGGLRTQVVATLGLAPLTLVFFQQLSLVGFLANLIAIPVVTLLITPLGLLGALASPLWPAAGLAAGPLIELLTYMGSWPAAVWEAGVAPLWAQASGLAGGALLIAPLPWRVRLLALPLVLPLLVPPAQRPAEAHVEVIAADVGQGTAVLVRTRRHLLVYDSGPAYSRDSDAGQRVLLPLLRALGHVRIDTLLLSHRDTDHTGGAAALLDGREVGELLHSLEPEHPLLAREVSGRRCEDGQRWQWDGVTFELLHPAPGATAPKPNSLSCVVRVTSAGGRLLLAGDIESAEERALVQRNAERLASDVLLVPHHGSKTSSTDGFLAAVVPRVAVVQAGYRNRFGHPADAVVERYDALGITLVRSDRCGAWRWRTEDGSMGCERETARRYWRHQPDITGLQIAH